MDEGVLYCGVDQPYFDQAVSSVKSLKSFSNVDATVLVSNDIIEKEDTELFDNTIVIPDNDIWHDGRDKLYNIKKTPYKRTVFLDGDTRIIGDISSIFQLLDGFEVAAAISKRKEQITIEGIPETFPEFNTGVLAYKNTDRVSDFIDKWIAIHIDQATNGRPNEEIPIGDAESLDEIKSIGRLSTQPPFREALYKSDIRYSVLPDEYNFGGWGRCYAYKNVKIIHGTKTRQDLLAPKINDELGPRVYLGNTFGKIYYENGVAKSIYPKSLRATNYIIRTLPIGFLFSKLGIRDISLNYYKKYKRQLLKKRSNE